MEQLFIAANATSEEVRRGILAALQNSGEVQLRAIGAAAVAAATAAMANLDTERGFGFAPYYGETIIDNKGQTVIVLAVRMMSISVGGAAAVSCSPDMSMRRFASHISEQAEKRGAFIACSSAPEVNRAIKGIASAHGPAAMHGKKLGCAVRVRRDGGLTIFICCVD